MPSGWERFWMGCWFEFSDNHGIPVVTECHIGIDKIAELRGKLMGLVADRESPWKQGWRRSFSRNGVGQESGCHIFEE